MQQSDIRPRGNLSRFHTALLIGSLLFAALPARSAEPVLVIAHRGASGYLPEHTLAAYSLAIDMGADFVEPDLVVTRDGVLVARHDRYLGTTTDVAEHPAFASRRRESGGREDWFVEDFSIAEIRQLRARQPFRGRSLAEDGKHAIPTFDEVISLVRQQQRETGRRIGIYPETKAPGHFKGIGLDPKPRLLAALARGGIPHADVPVIVQSFEPGILRELNAESDLVLVQLVSPASRETPNVPNIPLAGIAAYADGVGANKYLLLNAAGEDSGFVAGAHKLGLNVHTWTIRDDAVPERFLLVADEVKRYLQLGVDGFFTDFPDTGVNLRNQYQTEDLSNGPGD